MSIATFDTLKFAQRLEQAGIDPKHAAAFSEAQREAFSDAMQTQLATKSDIQGVKTDIQEVRTDVREIKTELVLIKWMLGIIILVLVLPLLKTFLPS